MIYQDGNKIQNANIVKKIGNDKFRIRVDIDTRIAGIDNFILSRNEFIVNGLNYLVRVENYVDFCDILESTKYQLLDQECDPYKIRKIMKYLEGIECVVEPIITFFKNVK